MKAQKAAAAMLAFCSAFSPAAGLISRADDTEEALTAITAETAVADGNGAFTATVYLSQLPETGLCAAEFAVAYDAAALSMTGVELLYDTGAQNAEDFAMLELPVFSYEDCGDRLRIRWGTGLMNADYWLKEEQAFIRISGTLSEKMPAGTRTELRIVPAAGETAKAEIAAGYVDADGNAHYCKTSVTHGAVWKPIDETGATMYGDIDLDGQRTVSDAVLMHRALAEELALSAAGYANADCEFDGVLTLADERLLLQCLLKGTEAVPLGTKKSS